MKCWIVIDVEDGEPIISAESQELAIRNLDFLTGFDVNKCKLIEDRKIVYDKEFQGNLIRVRTYEDELYGKIYKYTYEIWCIEFSQE